MILSKEISLKWNVNNIKRYTSKGYAYTKINNVFLVNISDISDSSHVLVHIECDRCGDNFDREYRDVIKGRKKHEVDLCKKCALESGIRKRDLNHVKGSMSFADWGISNMGVDFLDNYWSTDNFENPFEISYKSDRKIKIKCQKTDYHSDYSISCGNFVLNKRCPMCSSQKVHIHDSIGTYIINKYGCEQLDLIWSTKNTTSIFNISKSSGQKFWWKCESGLHNRFLRECSSSVNAEFRCPECVISRNESILQEKVRTYFEKYGFTLLHEQFCNIYPVNPNSKYKLPYDNEIIELKLICEVNGRHHYDELGFNVLSANKNNTTPKQELEYMQWKDKYKKDYAISQGYNYIEIPYWSERDDSYKKIIDDAISKIKQEEVSTIHG